MCTIIKVLQQFYHNIVAHLVEFIRPSEYYLSFIYETNDHGVLKDGREHKIDLRVFKKIDFINVDLNVDKFIECVEKMTHNSIIVSESSKFKGLKCVNISYNDSEMIMDNAQTELERKIRAIVFFNRRI